MKYGATFDMESGFSVVEETREAAIAALLACEGPKIEEEGATLEVFTCIAAAQSAASFVPPPDHIEEYMQEAAMDACGEWAEEWPQLDDDGSKALTVALIKWANEHVSKPRFFSPVSIERNWLTIGKDVLGKPYVSKITTTNELGETAHATVVTTEAVQYDLSPMPDRNWAAP